jgi:hypothetical protein
MDTVNDGDGGDDLARLLARAGLEIVGERGEGTEDVLPPRVAWRGVIAGSTVPTVAVPDDHDDLVGEVNARWYALATRHGVIGADGVFLLDVAGDRAGPEPRRWNRVRLTGEWDLAGVLGDRPGQPEFVTLSTDGDTLLGVTTEEYEVWLVALDRLGRRQESAAEAEARETPRERETAWTSLLRGPRPTKRLSALWAHGLARHPAAPEDVLRALVGHSFHLAWRPLPAAVVDAAVDHPDWAVRSLFADVHPGLTPAHWTRLILTEQDPRRLWVLTELAADRRETLTPAAHERIAREPSARIRAAATRLAGLPARAVAALAADPDPAVRAGACRHAWPRLDDPARRALLADPDRAVRVAALLWHHRERPLDRGVFEAERLPAEALETCLLDPGLADHLARRGDADQRRALAGNPHLSAELTGLLARDEDDGVRTLVSVRPELTEEQRAAIPVAFDPEGHYGPLAWVLALHDDTDAMRRLAASTHLLVRRSVARARHLPPDVATLLARDEDRVVHLFLAESCDDAPADMLLGVWRWWSGSLTHPDRPRGHPNFPRSGLLRHLRDQDPRMRRLALDDPDSTPEHVELLSRDQDEDVRRRAASDPRLGAASAVRLLDDPRASVRGAAARHPRLPARTIVRLLRDADTAELAAGHPALPPEIMRHMVRGLAP